LASKSTDEAPKEDEDFEDLTAEEVGGKAPCYLVFIPTKEVFKKLIKRATQIKDVITELNPQEAMWDKREYKEGDEDKQQVVFQEIGG
jgi:hypothetical protein